MNNRGFVTSSILKIVFVAIAALIISLAFVNSTNFRLYIIGGAILGMVIYGFSKKEPSKQQSKLYVLFGLIGVAMIMIPLLGITQNTFTSLSISDVDVKDAGKRILIFGSLGGGQALDIEFTPSQLNQFLQDQGYMATKTTRLTAEFVGGDIKFPIITNEDTPVKGIRKAGEVKNFLGSRVKECRTVFPNTVAATPAQFGSASVSCYEAYNNGFVNSISGTRSGGYSVKFSLDGESATLTDSSPRISLAGGKAIIDWRGNLLSVNDILTPSYKVYRIGNTIRMVNADAYSRTNAAYSSFQSCVGSGDVTTTVLNNCLSKFNQEISAALTSKAQEYLGSNANAAGLDFTQGEIRVILKEPNFIPTFTIELDATKVGIVKLSGIPDVLKCTENPVLEGAGTKALSAQVKNIGNSPGYFDFKITCDNPQFTARSESADFKAGETKSVGVQFSAGISSLTKETGKCTLTVTDRNSGKTDSCSFTGTVNYKSFVSECNVEGLTQCSSDSKTLFTCKSGKFESTKCDVTCGIEAGKAKCVQTKITPTEAPSVDIAADCKAKDEKQPWLGYSVVRVSEKPSTIEQAVTIITFGWIGDLRPSVTETCEPKFLKYYSLIAIMVILGVVALKMTGGIGRKK